MSTDLGQIQIQIHDLSFVDVANHGKGIGSAAWRALEGRYPQTRV